MSIVISVENLGKKYTLCHHQQESYTALRDVLANGAKGIGKRILAPFTACSPSPVSEDFWALKDVSFEVNQGDRIGIIGRNGAGKSTLLKILSRITEPTTGSVKIKGRVASLLEVGTGFHPELTGRENIFLNGAILGMSSMEIRKKFDEIVDFAEIEKFLDTPVKRYSSGMYVRLAFAVAAHLEPEILVIDEVLAVGDAQFQKKCLGKMEDVSAKEGRTVLFVSHNMNSVMAFTSSVVFLKEGQIAFWGGSGEGVSKYLDFGEYCSAMETFEFNKNFISDMRLTGISRTCNSGGRLELELAICPVVTFDFNIEGWIKDMSDCPIVYFAQGHAEKVVLKSGCDEIVITTVVELPLLCEGKYYLSLAISDPNKMTFAGTKNPIELEIVMCDPFKTGYAMKTNEAFRAKVFALSRSELSRTCDGNIIEVRP